MCAFSSYTRLSNLTVNSAAEPLRISLVTRVLTKTAKCKRACRSSFLSSLCARVLFRNGRSEKKSKSFVSVASQVMGSLEIWHEPSLMYFSKGTRTSRNPYWQPVMSTIHTSLVNSHPTFNTVCGKLLESGPGTSFVGISGFPI